MKRNFFSHSLLQSVIAGLFFVSFGVCSCSSEGEMDLKPLVMSKPTSYKLSPQEALDNAKPLLASLEAQKGGAKKTMARGVAYKTLKNAKVVFSDKTTSTTKQGDTLLYVLNLNEGGYIVAATDRRVSPVLAYVEKGEYNPKDTTNAGFNFFLEKTKAMIAAEKAIVEGTDTLHKSEGYTLQLYAPEANKYEAPAGWRLAYEVPKRLKTNWGQGFPFNKYMWNGYAGCVSVAMMQIMMHKKQPEYIANFEGIDKIPLDWNKIETEEPVMTRTPLDEGVREQLALLTSYLNYRLGATIRKGSTGAKTEKAVKILNSLGISADPLQPMGEDEMMSRLNEGGVLLSRGNRHSTRFLGIVLGYSEGHAWVIDGYKLMRNGSQRKVYLHCNWGWNGVDDGYYLWNCFHADHPETILDNPNISANAAHFKYDLLFSHVR